MTHDEHDDPLDDNRDELEARFRELEQDAEIERLRQEAGRAPASGPRGAGASTTDDDLSDLKASVDHGDQAPEAEADADAEADAEAYLLVICPECGARNRTSLRKVRASQPICGRCKALLSFRR
jgi:ribosomal protein L40E